MDLSALGVVSSWCLSSGDNRIKPQDGILRRKELTCCFDCQVMTAVLQVAGAIGSVGEGGMSRLNKEQRWTSEIGPGV